MMRVYRRCRLTRLPVLFSSALVLFAMWCGAVGIKEIHAASQTISSLSTADQIRKLKEVFVRKFVGIARFGESSLAKFNKQLQIKSIKPVSCATGCEFSYISKGASGLYSGDFFDLVMLDEDRLLVRFGDVMGHDLFSALVALTLVVGFHDNEALKIIKSLYLREDNGHQQALRVLKDVLQLKKSIFYTLTDSIIDLRNRKVSSLFLGSDYFMRVRKQSELVVDRVVGKEESRLPFIFMSDDFTMPADSYLAVDPHVFSYESGEYLVYISDGLMGRMVGDDLLSMTAIAEQLVAEAFQEAHDFADVAAMIHDKMLAASSSEELDDITVLVIKLP